MEYLPISTRELEILETLLMVEEQRVKRLFGNNGKEAIKYQAEIEGLLKKVVLKKMKLKSEEELTTGYEECNGCGKTVKMEEILANECMCADCCTWGPEE